MMEYMRYIEIQAESLNQIINKIFTSAGYNISWSFKKATFAVINYADDTLEAYKVNSLIVLKSLFKIFVNFLV